MFTFGERYKDPPVMFNKSGVPPKTQPPPTHVDFKENEEKEKEVPPYYQKKKYKQKKVHGKPSELIYSDQLKKKKSRKKCLHFAPWM